MNQEDMKVKDIINAIKKRWQLIVGITLVATILTTVVSFFVIKPKYQAATKLFIGKENGDQQTVYSNSDIQMYQQLIKTYISVINTNDLIEKALEDNNVNANSKSVLSNLEVIQSGTNTQILEIRYISENKELCKEVVDAITNEFVNYSPTLVPNATVKIVEKARLPQNPVSPNKKLNIAIAFVISAMIGIAISIMLEFMDNTFRDKESLEKFTDVPVIGLIPNADKVK